jgi:hypothetical protein
MSGIWAATAWTTTLDPAVRGFLIVAVMCAIMALYCRTLED